MSNAARTAGISRRFVMTLGLSSGLLLWVGFWLPFVTWFALVPLVLLVRLEVERRWIYLASWLGGLAYFVPGIQWVRLCHPTAWVGWLLLAIYLSIYFPAFVLLARILNRRWKAPLVFAAPVAWIALEFVRSHAFTGFPWLLAAHNLWAWPATIQCADLVGVWGVSFLVVTFAAFVVENLTLPIVVQTEQGIRGNRALYWRAAWALGILIATQVYGRVQLARAQFEHGPSVNMIHTSIPQSLKMAEEKDAHKQIMDDLEQYTTKASAVETDLLLWPETIFPYIYGDVAPDTSDLEIDRLRIARYLLREEPRAENGAGLRQDLLESRKLLTDFATKIGTPLLVGTIRYDFRPGLMQSFNSSVLVVPEAGPVDRYDKIHLVPFGEYLPLRNGLPFLQWFVPYNANDFGIDASRDYRSIHYGSLHFAPLICFEDALPHMARAFLATETPERPIDFFVNQSNDGWFAGSAEPDYHLAASVFRCIESRRPMVRVTNLGATALVDGNGAVLASAPSDRRKDPAFLPTIVPLDRRTSLYRAWGDWLPIGCLAFVLAGIVASGFRQLRLIKRRLGWE